MIKKIFLLLLVSLFLFTSIKVSKINAANTTYSDNQNGQWTPNKTEETNIFGMEHLSVYGVANKNNLQHINVLSMKTDGYSSKLVTWSVLDGNKKYTRQTLDKIAEDYEKTHPGWIVIGGINGDQYTTGFGSDIGAGSAYFTPQTYYSTKEIKNMNNKPETYVRSKINETIDESFSNKIYHFTTYENLLYIAKYNAFFLNHVGNNKNDIYLNRNNEYYLSFTREKSSEVGYPAYMNGKYDEMLFINRRMSPSDSLFVRIEVDGEKLNKNFKVFLNPFSIKLEVFIPTFETLLL